MAKRFGFRVCRQETPFLLFIGRRCALMTPQTTLVHLLRHLCACRYGWSSHHIPLCHQPVCPGPSQTHLFPLTTLKVHPASHLHRIIIRHEFCWVCALFICIDPSPQPQTRHLRNPVITTHTWHEHSRLPLKHAPSAYLRVFCRGRRHPRRALRRPWWAGCATCLAGPCATARSQGSRSYNTHKRSSAAFVSFPP